MNRHSKVIKDSSAEDKEGRKEVRYTTSLLHRENGIYFKGNPTRTQHWMLCIWFCKDSDVYCEARDRENGRSKGMEKVAIIFESIQRERKMTAE